MRLAVIGCGSIGFRHLINLLALGYRDLLAFDSLPEIRQKVHLEGRARVFDNLPDLWNAKPTAALIASPTATHMELALDAAKHGCHMFIEKPLAHNLTGMDELVRIVRSKNLVTMVGCNMRFHHGPKTVKKLLAEQAIGDLIAGRIQTGSYLPNWRPWQDFRLSYSADPVAGGAILDCIHEIDLTLWYFGPGRLVGSAFLPATVIGLNTEGLAEMILRHDTGVLSSIHLNFIQRDYRRSCQIIGSDGTLYWDFMEGRVRLYGPEGKISQEFQQPAEWEINQMYMDEMRHFCEALQDQRQTCNPLAGGVEALEIALAVRSGGE